MVDSRIVSRGISPDEEFTKRFSGVQTMLVHMKDRADLIRRIRNETAIPEHARDLAIKALSAELKENKSVFFDYLLNFVSVSMQVLHRADIEMEFTIIDSGRIKMNSNRLIVDNEIMDIPIEIGTRFMTLILDNKGAKIPDAILMFFNEEEARYDKLFGGIMDRCSLQIMDELYPRRCSHVKLKLPAQSLIEYRVTL
jgi:hypothetical protein